MLKLRMNLGSISAQTRIQRKGESETEDLSTRSNAAIVEIAGNFPEESQVICFEKRFSQSILRKMAFSGEPRMVAQGGGFGRALSGWIRSAGKSSVREIANPSHFCGVVSRFQGGMSQSSPVKPPIEASSLHRGAAARTSVQLRPEREFSANSQSGSRDVMAPQSLVSGREN